MALTLKFVDNDVGGMPCPNTLDCAACGGQPPYTFSVTVGSIVKLSATTARISPPANPGSGEGGVAYNKSFYTPCSDPPVQPKRTGNQRGCADQVLGNSANGACDTGEGSSSCGICGDKWDTCPHCPNLVMATCAGSVPITVCIRDIRSALQITLECQPCGIIMNGVVVTVTDKNGVSVNRTLKIKAD